MNLIFLGRGLLVGGLIATLISAAPAILLGILPPALSQGLFGVIAAMLVLTVTPLAVVVFSAGAVLLLLGLWRRRGRP